MEDGRCSWWRPDPVDAILAPGPRLSRGSADPPPAHPPEGRRPTFNHRYRRGAFHGTRPARFDPSRPGPRGRLLLRAGSRRARAGRPALDALPGDLPGRPDHRLRLQGRPRSVPAGGGEARPLTLGESYEFSPVWSHDGSSIAFASDRYGNFDVFVMPAAGGEAIRLTFHSTREIPSAFTADDGSVLFSAYRQELATDAQFPVGLMTQLYSVPVGGGRVGMVRRSRRSTPRWTPRAGRSSTRT